VAASAWIHRQSSSPGSTRRRHVQDVVHQLHVPEESLVWRRVSRAGSLRTNPLDGPLRRSEPAGADDRDGAPESGLDGDRGADRAGRAPGCHPAGCLHGWLAGVAHIAGAARRARDSGIEVSTPPAAFRLKPEATPALTTER